MKTKRTLFLLLVLAALLLAALAIPALAAEAVTLRPAQPDGAYDWAQLATIAGATAATLLIVQFIKLPLDKVWKVPTRAVVYSIALLIMIFAQTFTEGLEVSQVPLLAINAFVVALAAMGGYELTFAKNKKD